MYKVMLTPHAERGFLKLEPNMRMRVSSVLERISISPHPHMRKLSGTDFFRVRVGDYRAIAHVDDAKMEIWVLKIGHRSNIYG
jgi:mRNA interferase RelE/StbE